MNKRRAFTLVEVIAVITLVAILVAILFPVFQQVKKRAYETVCVSNLHQIDVAIELYRPEYGDEKLDVGAPADMGLPFDYTDMVNLKLLSRGACVCPAGSAITTYFQVYPDGPQSDPEWQYDLDAWLAYIQRYQDSAAVLFDMNHDVGDNFLVTPFQTHRGLAVYLNGSVRWVTRKGTPARNDSWWN